MTQTKKLPSYSRQKQLLQRLSILEPSLLPRDVIEFTEYASLLSMDQNAESPRQRVEDRIRIVMEVLNEAFKERTLIVVLKKCAILHIVVHEAAKKGIWSEGIQAVAHFYAAQITNQDIPVLAGTAKPKPALSRDNSLTRIYKAVRSLSSSKEKAVGADRTRLQVAKDKGGIRELLQKVVTPYSYYLLKVTQDLQTYSSTLSSPHDFSSMGTLKWKLNNYMLSLSKLSFQFSRLAKYYLQELIGPWVLISYTVSLDVAVYYNSVVTHLSQQATSWRDTIAMALKFSKINRRHRQELEQILEDKRLLQLKDEIELVSTVKENLFYLYYNIHTQQWTHLFEAPFTESSQKAVMMAPLQYILDVYEQFFVLRNDREDRKVQERRGSQEKTVRRTASTASLKEGARREERCQQQLQKTPKTSSTLRGQQGPSRSNNFIQAKKAKAMGK